MRIQTKLQQNSIITRRTKSCSLSRHLRKQLIRTLQPWLKTLFSSCGTQIFVIAGSAAFCEQAHIGKVVCAINIPRVFTSDLLLIVNQCLATVPELQGADLASPHTTIIRMTCHMFAYTCT